jgi:hypothetical protein
MSYTYLQAEGEVSSAECFSDIAPSVRSRLSLTAETSYSSANAMESCRGSRSGTTCEHSPATSGEDESTSSAAASPVRTSVSQAREPESKENGQGSGPKWPGSFAKWDRVSCSWKTRQPLLRPAKVKRYSRKWWVHSLTEFGSASQLICAFDSPISTEFWETLPRWGSMRNGELFQRKTLSGLEAHRQWIISAKESGSLESIGTPTTCHTGRSKEFRNGRRPTPQEIAEQATTTMPTPTVNGNYNRKGLSPTSGDGLATAVKKLTRVPTPHGFSKDGQSNGPSGNELGRAVNQMQRVPTPAAQDAKNSTLPPSQGGRDSVPGFMIRDGQTGGSLNPNWVEWLMGWPIGWTDSRPLATDKFQQWLHSHGGY